MDPKRCMWLRSPVPQSVLKVFLGLDGWAASVSPLLLSYPECDLTEIQQFLYRALHLFPVVRLS